VVKNEAAKQKKMMLDSVEKMKRMGKFTKENMAAHGFIDIDHTSGGGTVVAGALTTIDQGADMDTRQLLNQTVVSGLQNHDAVEAEMTKSA
jgi:hypothetical protein